MTTTESTTAATALPKPGTSAEDLDDLPLPPRRGSRLTASTAVLALCAVACTGFALGVVVEKRQVPPTRVTSGTGTAGAGQTGRATTTVAGSRATGTTVAGAGGAGAGGAGGPGGAGALQGQVTGIEGTTLLVTDSSGNVVRVTTSGASTVTRSSTGTVADIKQGDYVTVQGPTAADGTTTANRIVDTGSTPAAGAGAAGRPAGGAGAGAGAGQTPGTGSVPGTGARPNRPTTTVP